MKIKKKKKIKKTNDELDLILLMEMVKAKVMLWINIP